MEIGIKLLLHINYYLLRRSVGDGFMEIFAQKCPDFFIPVCLLDCLPESKSLYSFEIK